MRSPDTLAMGFRSLKERPLETGLIILGITLASCVAAASLLLLLSQKAQSEQILSGAAYREILVSSTTDPGASTSRSGITLVNQQATQNFSLDSSDMAAVMSQIPLVAFAYRAETTRFRTGQNNGPGGGGIAIRATDAAAPPAFSSAAAPADMPPEIRAEIAAMQEAATATGLLEPKLETFNGANVNPSFFVAYGVNAALGSLFTEEDAVNNAAVAVLGPRLTASLFPDVAPADLIGQKARVNNRLVTIVGILDEDSAGMTLANGNSLADLAFAPIRQQGFSFGGGPDGGPGGNTGGQTRNLRFAVANAKDLAPAAEALTKYFDDKYGEGKVSMTIPFDNAQLSQSGFERLLWIIVAFGVGTLVMALINLMNMMLTRALRRQAAMGILSAMGANRGDLAALQAVEGGLMALTGTVLGVALAIPLYDLLYQAGKSLFNLTTATAPFDWTTLLLVSPALLVLTLLLALLPAWQTSKISITTALRSE